jgi:hypothetical protein
MLAILPASSVLGRALAVALAGGLAQPPTEAPPAVVTQAPDEDPSVGLAHARFDKGLAAYEAGDYAGAAEQWTEAYSLMASVPGLVGARNVLAFDLAQAQLRAYDADGERHRLLAAKELLDRYVAWVDRPGHTMNAAEREDRPRAIEMLARIDVELRPISSPVVERPAAAVPAAVPPHTHPSARERFDAMKRARNLIIGGSVMLGLGVAAGATAVGLSVRANAVADEFALANDDLEREHADFRGRRLNAGVITAAVGAATFTVIGVPLLAAGLVQRRRALRMTPAVSPTHAGLQLHFAF